MEEEKNPKNSSWILEKCVAEYSLAREDYIFKLKIEAPKKIAKLDTLSNCIKNFLFPLSQDFIFSFQLENFLSSCENIDSFLLGSKNPIQTLQTGMSSFLEECFNRDDVMGSMPFGKYFSLGESLSKVNLLPLKQVLCYESKVAEEEMVIKNADFDCGSNILVLTSQLSGFLANFGRIWSIVEEVPLTCVEVLELKVEESIGKVEIKNLLTYRSEDVIQCGSLMIGVSGASKKKDEERISFESGKGPFDEDWSDGDDKENSFDQNQSILGEWHVK